MAPFQCQESDGFIDKMTNQQAKSVSRWLARPGERTILKMGKSAELLANHSTKP
jgi:hypothetical protein